MTHHLNNSLPKNSSVGIESEESLFEDLLELEKIIKEERFQS